MAFLTPDKTYEINGVTVKDYLLTDHNPNRIDMPNKRTKNLLGITIHNTEDIVVSSKTTKSEQYTRATVNGNMGLTRVHYYVDETEAWHNLPDNWCGWHAADGSGDGNTATIAIEVIGKTAKAEENAAKLAAGLMKQYGLTTDNLYTHTHWMNIKHGATGTREYLNTLKNKTKNCPAYILPHWSEFEKTVGVYLAELTTSDEDKPTTIYRIQLGAYSVLANAENAENFLKTVKAAGFENAFIKTETIEKVAVKEEKPSIAVGCKVKLKKGATTYDGGALAAFVYDREYLVKEIKGDRVVISYDGYVIAAVKAEDLECV